MDSSWQLYYRVVFVTIKGPNIRASAGRTSQICPVISFVWITLLKCWESKLLLTLYGNYISEFELQGFLMTNTSFYWVFVWTSSGATFLLILNPAPFCWDFLCSSGLIWFPSQSPEICQTRSHSVLPSRSNTLFKLENSGVVRHWYSWMQICDLVVLIELTVEHGLWWADVSGCRCHDFIRNTAANWKQHNLIEETVCIYFSLSITHSFIFIYSVVYLSWSRLWEVGACPSAHALTSTCWAVFVVTSFAANTYSSFV